MSDNIFLQNFDAIGAPVSTGVSFNSSQKVASAIESRTAKAVSNSNNDVYLGNTEPPVEHIQRVEVSEEKASLASRMLANLQSQQEINSSVIAKQKDEAGFVEDSDHSDVVKGQTIVEASVINEALSIEENLVKIRARSKMGDSVGLYQKVRLATAGFGKALAKQRGSQKVVSAPVEGYIAPKIPVRPSHVDSSSSSTAPSWIAPKLKHVETRKTYVPSSDPVILSACRKLISAAGNGSVTTCKGAIHEGADVNYEDPDTLQTALHVACLEGHSSVVSYLIEIGASIDVHDKEGRSPIVMAILSGSEELMHIFCGDDDESILFLVHYRFSDGGTFLHEAVKLGNSYLLTLLCNTEWDDETINAVNSDGYTALWLACMFALDGPPPTAGEDATPFLFQRMALTLVMRGANASIACGQLDEDDGTLFGTGVSYVETAQASPVVAETVSEKKSSGIEGYIPVSVKSESFVPVTENNQKIDDADDDEILKAYRQKKKDREEREAATLLPPSFHETAESSSSTVSQPLIDPTDMTESDSNNSNNNETDNMNSIIEPLAPSVSNGIRKKKWRNHGRSLLYEVCRRKDSGNGKLAATLAYMLIRYGKADFTVRCRKGFTPLHILAAHNRPLALKSILDAGIQLDSCGIPAGDMNVATETYPDGSIIKVRSAISTTKRMTSVLDYRGL